MKKAVIFDLDGTLWDSSQQVVDSWNEVLEQTSDSKLHLTVKDMQGVMGKPMDEIARILFCGVKEERAMELLDLCCKHENEYLRQNGAVLFPELRETLQALANKYELYIVSNCQEGYIEAFLAYYHLEEYISDTENYEHTGLQKGDNIRLVVERNHYDQAVYVGDIQGDYDATMQAGLPFIHARYGFGSIAAEVPYVNALPELIEVCEAIFMKFPQKNQ